MAWHGVRASLLAGLAICLPLTLSGCGGGPSPQTFPPYTYAYLRPLRLNVASIDVVNDFAPGPDDIGGQAPESPVAALTQMAHDRLVPAGAAGRAEFTIEQASLTENGDTISGSFRVKVDIYTSDGQRAAFAEAAVAHSAAAPKDQSDAGMRAALYSFIQAMMRDMNVEIEYQLRRSVGDWLQTGAAIAPPPPPVTQQTLPPPGANSAATPGYQLVPSPPPAPNDND